MVLQLRARSVGTMLIYSRSNPLIQAAARFFSEPARRRPLLILIAVVFIGSLLVLRSAYPLDFPKIHDPKSLQMNLERTPCLGMCPSYSIEVYGDGTVLYNGSSNVAVHGQHRGKISEQNVAGILQAFRGADFFNLRDRYTAHITDLPTYTISIKIDGHYKMVIDYGGSSWLVGMPRTVRKLEETIDELAGSSRWTKGDATTFRALADEKWDFRSGDAADTLARIARYGSASALRDLIAAGVPLNGRDGMWGSALDAAASLGNIEKLDEILKAQPRPDPSSLSTALSNASYSGRLEAVEYLLQHGADPNIRPPSGDPPLVAAAQSGVPAFLQEILNYRPDISIRGREGRTALIAGVDAFHTVEGNQVNRLEIARLLLAAGAEIDARNDNGETALIKNAWDPKIAILLIQHGADVNASDNRGWTPLFSASSAELTRALLQHGANIGVRNKEGKTPLDQARQYGNREIVAVLVAANGAKSR